MKAVFLSILGAFILLGLSFLVIGGRFDRPFWLEFLPGLMENLAVLALAIFVIDRIFSRERNTILSKANAGQSRFIELLCNLLAYALLEYLGSVDSGHRPEDPEANFSWALEKLRAFDLSGEFYTLFMAAKNRTEFLDGFVKVLSDRTKGIDQAVSKIFPFPHPDAKRIVQEMPLSIGMVSGIGMLLKAFAETSVELKPEDRFKPEQEDVLLKVAFHLPLESLRKINRDIVALADRAVRCQLFISLN